jgi:hypothetical protein
VTPLDGRVEPAPIEDDPAGSRLLSRVHPPPSRASVVVTAHRGPITGERVVWQSPQGWHFDLRAAREPYDAAGEGPRMVDVVAEIDWYRSILTGDRGVTVAVFAHTLFLERPPP